MATKDEHHDKWLHNRQFVTTIGDEYPDWIVVAIFYSAVHLVEMFLDAKHKHSSESHSVRNTMLRETPKYRMIWQNFRPLYTCSKMCRYKACSPNHNDWVTIEQIDVDLVQRYYDIEKTICRQLKIDQPNFKIR